MGVLAVTTLSHIPRRGPRRQRGGPALRAYPVDEPPVGPRGLTVLRSEVEESAVSAFHDVCLFRWCQLADFFLPAGEELEWIDPPKAHRYGEARIDTEARSHPVRSAQLPVLSPVHPAPLPAEAVGGGSARPRAAAQLCAGAEALGSEWSLFPIYPLPDCWRRKTRNLRSQALNCMCLGKSFVFVNVLNFHYIICILTLYTD